MDNLFVISEKKNLFANIICTLTNFVLVDSYLKQISPSLFVNIER